MNLFDSKKLLFFLWLSLLVFPKGGIKIAGIPITWGYLLLGLIFIFLILRRGWSIHSSRATSLMCLLPFQLISGSTMVCYGIENLQWGISFLISFFFLPSVFLFFLSKEIEELDLSFLFKLIRVGVSFISYYGIFLFFYKSITGKYLEIPFLTVNWGDLGTLDDSKCNSRGDVSKLISTYNNGQLFGISMSMILPLYYYIQTNTKHKIATKVALILTLSRTAWLGLIFAEFFYHLFIEKNKTKSIKTLTGWIFVLLCGLACISFFYGYKADFFLDTNLGGRREQLQALENWTFMPNKPFGYISEMTYVGMVDFFGVIGLFAYLLGMAGSLALRLPTPMAKARLCVACGLMNYLLVSVSDGATLYIPVLAFYWFFLSLFGRKNWEYSISASETPRRTPSSVV